MLSWTKLSEMCPIHVRDMSQMLLNIAKSGQGELDIVTLMEQLKRHQSDNTEEAFSLRL